MTSVLIRELKQLGNSSDGFVIHLTLANGQRLTIAPYIGEEDDDYISGDLCGDEEPNDKSMRTYVSLAQIATARFEEL